MGQYGTFSAEQFGQTDDGEIVWKLTLCADSGLQVQVLSFGATIHRLLVPTAKGAVDVVLGKASLSDYLQNGLCNSSVIGRCANRIAGGVYMENGRLVQLEQNFGKHCIHGGSGCYAAKNFSFSVRREAQALRLCLRHLDDGAGGFPGHLFFGVDYVLRENALQIEYSAIPTERTPWNVTSHTYFDLNGHGSGQAEDQQLQIFADHVLYTAPDGIPEPAPVPVCGTDFDFRAGRLLRQALCGQDAQLRQQNGFDHNYCLRGSGYRKAAILYGCHSRITMEVWTDEPGLQLFTLNETYGGISGKDGARYRNHDGVCLETQQYPNAVNVSAFPSPFIEAGKRTVRTTCFRFLAAGQEKGET